MKLILALALLASCARTTSSSAHGPALGIAGGTNASADQAASTALIILRDAQTKDTVACSGVVIAPELVATAAHCFTPKGAKPHGASYAKFVLFGASRDLGAHGDASGALMFGEKDYVVNPQFARTGADDIALIHLAGAKLTPVAIAAVNLALPVTLVGFGQHSPNAPADMKFGLQQMTTTVSAHASGPHSFAVNVAKTERPLLGDSGGPALQTAQGKTYVAGLDSWTEDGSTLEHYTSLNDELAWIKLAAKSLKASF